MGQMGVAIGGGIAGLALAAVTGGAALPAIAIGFSVGNMIGGMLFPPKAPDGPRLSDLTVMSSAFGATIPIGYGTFRIPGNLIWSTPLVEHEQEAGGKGMGGGALKQNTFTYTVSFAIAFCEGPAEDLLRIWADNTLIYDKTLNISGGTTTDSSGNTVTLPGLMMHFHPGDETQLPDEIIEAVVGVGQTPAYRGLAYIAVTDLDLTAYGNRIPQLTAEITFDKVPAFPAVVAPLLGDSAGSDAVAVDPATSVAFRIDALGIEAVDLSTMTPLRYRAFLDGAATPATTGNWSGSGRVGLDGYLYGRPFGANSGPLVKVDPLSLMQVASLGSFNAGLANTATEAGDSGDNLVFTTGPIGFAGYIGDAGLVNHAVLLGFFGTIAVVETERMVVVWYNGQEGQPNIWHGSGGTVVPYLIGPAAGASYVVANLGTAGALGGPAPIDIFRLRVALAEVGLDSIGSIGPADIAAICPAAAAAGIVGFFGTPTSAWFDPADNGLLLGMQVTGPGGLMSILMKWREGTGLVWAIVPPAGRLPPGGMAANIVNSRFAYFGIDGSVITIDTRHGEATQTFGWPGGIGGDYYDGSREAILSAGGTLTQRYLDRATGTGPTVGAIVSDLASRVGLLPGDLQMDALDDTVTGFYIASPSTPRGDLLVLQQAFFFDIIETDGVLRGVKRGSPAVRALGQDALMPAPGTDAMTAGAVLLATRLQDLDLPSEVTIKFIDALRDGQPGSQTVRRRAQPIPTMRSQASQVIELAVVMTSTQGRRVAEATLYATWAERISYALGLTFANIDLDPTDVLFITLDDGTTATPRILSIQAGADYSLQLTAASNGGDTYVSSARAATPPLPLRRTVSLPSATRLILLNVPLLRDTDDSGGLSSCIYMAASGYGATSWPGCIVQRSLDGGDSYATVVTASVASVWGVCATALPDNPSPWTWDALTTLTIILNNPPAGDALASASDLMVLNGANVFAVRSGADWEIIQAATIVQNVDGSFTLSRLLRGRRGSEVFCAGHAPGDLIVLLQPAATRTEHIALSEISAPRLFKGVTVGLLPEGAVPIGFTARGNDLKPYAPGHVAAARVGADVVLTWVRRSRLGGEMRDGVDVPLGEASEAYRVDILAGPGGAVVRSLTATTPTATYLAATIASDFLVAPTSLTVRVYQISAAVGAGFSREITVEIT